MRKAILLAAPLAVACVAVVFMFSSCESRPGMVKSLTDNRFGEWAWVERDEQGREWLHVGKARISYELKNFTLVDEPWPHWPVTMEIDRSVFPVVVQYRTTSDVIGIWRLTGEKVK